MNAKLLYRDAQGREQALAIAGDAATYVGRSSECAVRIDDQQASRRHACIREHDGRFWVEDLASVNGTFVNEGRIAGPVPLAPNDVVRCGATHLRFVADAPPANVARAMPCIATSDDALRIAELESQTASLRNEAQGLHRRLEEATTRLTDLEAALYSQRQLTEDQALELTHYKDQLAHTQHDLAETREDLASRTRQLARAHSDIAAAQAETERHRRDLAECLRHRETHLATHNRHLAETEQLRQVIHDQCTLLEEQRIRLLTLESRAPRPPAEPNSFPPPKPD
jgi:FHA domain-containing protein